MASLEAGCRLQPDRRTVQSMAHVAQRVGSAVRQQAQLARGNTTAQAVCSCTELSGSAPRVAMLLGRMEDSAACRAGRKARLEVICEALVRVTETYALPPPVRHCTAMAWQAGRAQKRGGWS